MKKVLLSVSLWVLCATPLVHAADEAKSPQTNATAPRLALDAKAPDIDIPEVTFDNGEPIVTQIKLSTLFAKDLVMLCFVSDTGASLFQQWQGRIKDDKKFYADFHVVPVFVISADPGAPVYFKKQLRFPFYIAADPKGDIAKAYGLPDSESFDAWSHGKSPNAQVCLIDRAGTIRYWCSPFTPKEDYEYVAYRAQLLDGPADDPNLKRVEARERQSNSAPAKPAKKTPPKSK